MKQRMTLKLFLVLLLTVGLVVITMLLMTRWSFQHGFTDYLNQLDEAQVGEVVERLQQHYQIEGSWQRLRQRRTGVWRALTQSSDNAEERVRQRRTSPMDERFSRPPRPHRFDASDPLNIGPRLALFDTSNRQISGRPTPLNQLQRYPLQVNGTPIGWLGITPIKAPSNLRDVRFAQRQTSNLYLIGLFVIVVAALVSLLLAHRLLVPIRALAEGARRLARGEYKSHVPVSSRDELGQLSVDFNHLASTLSANEASRQRWIADISHELRTPLSILRGEIEAMQDGIRRCDAAALQSLHSEVGQLNKLVDDLYQLSLSDLGALDYQMQQIDLDQLLQQVLESQQSSFTAAGVALTWKEMAKVSIYADPERLTQLLHNLLANSLRYTDASGRVTVCCYQDRDVAGIVIEDSTPGVTKEALPQLFDRLYRQESSRNRAKGGAGLGLAIVQNIVQAVLEQRILYLVGLKSPSSCHATMRIGHEWSTNTDCRR